MCLEMLFIGNTNLKFIFTKYIHLHEELNSNGDLEVSLKHYFYTKEIFTTQALTFKRKDQINI